MTNTTTDTPEAGSDEVARTPDTVPAPPAAPTPFWQRPLVERYLVPLFLPIFVVVGLVAYVLNISRIFLSAHGHNSIIAGTVITVLILLGATLLSAAPRLRTSGLTLVGAAFVLAIMGSGWLVLGHAQPEKTGPVSLPATLKVTQTLPTITAAPGSNLVFSPNTVTAKTGLAKINVAIATSGHTFNIHEADTLFPGFNLDQAGTTKSGIAFFPAPGTYNYFCAVPGHEAAGMHGTITVTGPAMTLAQALTAAGNPANAVAG